MREDHCPSMLTNRHQRSHHSLLLFVFLALTKMWRCVFEKDSSYVYFHLGPSSLSVVLVQRDEKLANRTQKVICVGVVRQMQSVWFARSKELLENLCLTTLVDVRLYGQKVSRFSFIVLRVVRPLPFRFSLHYALPPASVVTLQSVPSGQNVIIYSTSLISMFKKNDMMNTKVTLSTTTLFR